ncbi:MAG: outer membrane beta-barrel protein [Kofleriaceae bacterium]|nr:outer membrane beta-barrel protein [Kofleriaceae bacterium]
MRNALAPLMVLSVALPSLADARPITAGVDLGLSAAKSQGEGADPGTTVGLFARVGLTSRLSGQLEVQRIRMPDGYGTSGDIKTATALLVVELGRSGNLVPTLMVGAGVDRASEYNYPSRATHIEGGFGLEYRMSGGFSLGADLRMGGRSLDEDEYVAYDDRPQIALYAPSPLQAGEYRSGRVTLGVRF